MNRHDDGMQKRLMAVMVLSFSFFLFYDYFISPKKTNIAQTQSNISTKQAPKVKTQPQIEDLKAPSINNFKTLNTKNTINKYLVKINNKNFTFLIDEYGRIASAIIKNPKYENTEIISSDDIKPTEIRFQDGSINKEAFETKYTSKVSNVDLIDTKTITIYQKLSSLNVAKTFTFNKNGSYDVSIKLSKNVPYFITTGFTPIGVKDDFAFHGVLIKKQDATLEMIDDEDLSSSKNFKKSIITASANKYFTSLFYDFNSGLNTIVDTYKGENPLIFIQGTNNQVFHGYIGEKNYLKLKNIDTRLLDVIEYGFITFIAKYVFAMLLYINNIIGDWGWSIIVLTVVIRLAMYPLTYKGMVSMNKIKELAPKIKDIQEKYKGNPQRSGAAMMELYKKHNANPMGGCLPFILQIPIFFSIYRVLLNAIELKGSEWILWINDLSVMDPYFVLPLLMGASMYLQQKLTPNTIADPMQRKIFQYLPVVFTVFFLTFPAGLVLYWFVNNLFTIAQQLYINRLFEKKKLLKEND